MKKVRETYSDALGDLINLDFAPKGAAKPVPRTDAETGSTAAGPRPPSLNQRRGAARRRGQEAR